MVGVPFRNENGPREGGVPSARAWLKIALDGAETNCWIGYSVRKWFGMKWMGWKRKVSRGVNEKDRLWVWGPLLGNWLEIGTA
jgi:hypothetical protein